MTKMGHGADDYPAGMAPERSGHGGSAFSAFSDSGSDLEAGIQDSVTSRIRKGRSSVSRDSSISFYGAAP